MNILVTMPADEVRDTFLPPEVVGQIEKLGHILWNETKAQLTPEELRAKLKGMDACITGWGTPQFTDEVLAGADCLKIVAHTAGSVAPIVSDALYDHGVAVVSGNNAFAESVAESVIAYIMAYYRKLPYYDGLVKGGGWRGTNFYNRGLLDRTVGLVGFGAIPRYLVGMLKPFRAKIYAYDKYVSEQAMADCGVQAASPEKIFSDCDIVSLHLPALEETHHMIDSRLLGMMREGALLVNTSRGSVMDEAALAEVLASGRIGAALDVFEREPLESDSPLRRMENVLLIPHMSGPTIDRRKYAALLVIEDIERLGRGEALQNGISRERARLMTH